MGNNNVECTPKSGLERKTNDRRPISVFTESTVRRFHPYVFRNNPIHFLAHGFSDRNYSYSSVCSSSFSEEPWLRQQYGKTYEDYCKEVPRFIGLRSFKRAR